MMGLYFITILDHTMYIPVTNFNIKPCKLKIGTQFYCGRELLAVEKIYIYNELFLEHPLYIFLLLTNEIYNYNYLTDIY